MHWTKITRYMAEASDMNEDEFECPECKAKIQNDEMQLESKPVKKDGEIVEFQYIHSCGVILVVIND